MGSGSPHAYRHGEMPPDERDTLRRAKRLEWITIAYLATAIVVVFLTLGSSQAMKAAWIEDLLSLLPPAAFLIACRYRDRRPDADHPWGFHRTVSLAYLAAAITLLVFGSYIFLESVMKLVTAEHPSIGVVSLFGEQVWLGWMMVAALIYTGVPPVILGRKKLPLARALHDKVLYADAEMNRADWMTAAAAAVGIIGIGFGWWFADAVAAAVIATDIIRDGLSNVRAAAADLMDARPSRYDSRDPHPLLDRIAEIVRDCGWIREGRLRLREEGHVFAGELLVVPVEDDAGLTERLQALREKIHALDWKLHDVVVAPVPSLEDEPPGGMAIRGAAAEGSPGSTNATAEAAGRG